MKAPILLSLASLATAFNCTKSTFQSFIDANDTKAVVEFAVPIAEKGSFNPEHESASQYPTGLPASCAIQLNVTSAANSHYTVGMFLPDKWNGRFLGAASGGGINWLDMGTATHYGFATVSSNLGHDGGDQVGTWAVNNPEAITDWAYRAWHGSTVVGKMITNKWYGKSPDYSYFTGCSVGGKQGMKEMQMYPDDYDGVISGAPPWWTTHNQLYNFKQTTYQAPANSSHAIPADAFPVLAAEVMRQCDPQDGLKDAIISDPFGCHFNPLTLACKDGNMTGCLTGPQIDTLYKIYNNWVEVNQTYVYSHIVYGSECDWETGNIGLGAESTIGQQYWYIRDVMGLTNFVWQDLDYETVLLADKLNPGNASADNFDISPFHARGGKFIHYHGLADSIVAPGASIYYYEHAAREVLRKGVEMDDFYRMFLIPGMQHCEKTPDNTKAPWYIAAPNQASTINSSTYSTPGFMDARHDILLAMMNWVENGTAPADIVATKWVNDAEAAEVSRQRPICAYPKQAKYKGSGNPDEAENWECASLY